jgi:hypothetical protein
LVAKAEPDDLLGPPFVDLGILHGFDLHLSLELESTLILLIMEMLVVLCELLPCDLILYFLL